MQPTIIRATAPAQDHLPRTDWLPPEVKPSIVGEYEARTAGGHVFRRRWTEAGWLNATTGLVSTAPLEWRGVQPGKFDIGLYPRELRAELAAGLQLLDRLANAKRTDELIAKGEEVYARTGGTAPSDTHAAAMGALYS